MFCTYAHYTPQGRLFYIGKGSSEHRAYRMKGRNNYWDKIVVKYGKPEVQILANWNTEEEAFSHEVLLISCFRDMGYKLANLTNGGDGASGYKQTEEHRRKNSLARKGKPAVWNIGRKYSGELKRKCGAKNIGKKLTEDHKQKISKHLVGNKYAVGNTNRIKYKIIGTHMQTGEQIELLGAKAVNAAGFQHANVIKCIYGERKSHKGYTWSKELLENK
jgi:hypothetical protein